jgi:hypothetical protein
VERRRAGAGASTGAGAGAGAGSGSGGIGTVEGSLSGEIGVATTSSTTWSTKLSVWGLLSLGASTGGGGDSLIGGSLGEVRESSGNETRRPSMGRGAVERCAGVRWSSNHTVVRLVLLPSGDSLDHPCILIHTSPSAS